MILPAHSASDWGPALDAAVRAVSRGQAIILPTDTVYGIGCDAFAPAAIAAVLAAKGRDRQTPPPVLIASVAAVDGLARAIPEAARELMAAFWPGPLTIVVQAQPSLAWDLGDTGGTVALRVPNHPTALALLARTGPLAVTSANRTGQPPATTADEAERALGESVAVVLDAGPSPVGEASTIVEATTPQLRILRAGALSREAIEGVVGSSVWAEGADA